MQRAIETLKTTQFDLLVIGAGAHGVFAAMDATLRGLKVALIDQGDLCSGTSHNSLRTLHGGIRYLQYLQFGRTLESIREQAHLARMAPDLVRTLPFVMPCEGLGMRGPIVMLAGLLAHQCLRLVSTLDINGLQHLPSSKVIGAERYRQEIPGIEPANLSGAAIWHEVQLQDTNALLLASATKASADGAAVANYVRCIELRHDNAAVVGGRCEDRLTGEIFDIQAKVTLNATGPWAEDFLQQAASGVVRPLPVALNDSFNVLLKRQLFKDRVVAIPSAQRVEGEAVADANRMYFVVPWRDRSILGTVQVPWIDEATYQRDKRGHEDQLIEEVNAAYPEAQLLHDDIDYVYWGRVPTEDAPDETGKKRRDCFEVIDHRQRDELNGLVSIVGVKLTTARLVAQQAVDALMQQLSQPFVKGSSHKVQLSPPTGYVNEPDIGHLNDEKTFKQRIENAITNQMVITASDFLYRRTDLGILGDVQPHHLQWLADALPSQPNHSVMDTQ